MTSERVDYPGNGENQSEGHDAVRGEEGEESPAEFHFQLFVAGSSSRSHQAIRNIRRICDEYLPGRYHLKIVDVFEDPSQAREYQILAVPTLLKELPHPLRKIVGDLSEKEKVLEGLDIHPRGGS